ncbi:MAG: OmpH family outer membrane protein [Bacteroidetes bacterium]|nr:OmpH family outer membrane protein [Bacteroidota bacterium]
MKNRFVFVFSFLMLFPLTGAAQSKIGFFDSNLVMEKLPEVKDVQSQLDILSDEWRREIQKMKKELDEKFQAFRTQQLLYSEEVRRKKEDEIIAMEQKIAEFQNQKFGVNGELFTKQSELMKPIQNSIFKAVKLVAEEEKLDYVFDRSSQLAIFYANPSLDLTEAIIKKIRVTGIDNQ